MKGGETEVQVDQQGRACLAAHDMCVVSGFSNDDKRHATSCSPGSGKSLAAGALVRLPAPPACLDETAGEIVGRYLVYHRVYARHSALALERHCRAGRDSAAS